MPFLSLLLTRRLSSAPDRALPLPLLLCEGVTKFDADRRFTSASFKTETVDPLFFSTQAGTRALVITIRSQSSSSLAPLCASWLRLSLDLRRDDPSFVPLPSSPSSPPSLHQLPSPQPLLSQIRLWILSTFPPLLHLNSPQVLHHTVSPPPLRSHLQQHAQVGHLFTRSLLYIRQSRICSTTSHVNSQHPTTTHTHTHTPYLLHLSDLTRPS